MSVKLFNNPAILINFHTFSTWATSPAHASFSITNLSSSTGRETTHAGWWNVWSRENHPTFQPKIYQENFNFHGYGYLHSRYENVWHAALCFMANIMLSTLVSRWPRYPSLPWWCCVHIEQQRMDPVKGIGYILLALWRMQLSCHTQPFQCMYARVV